MPGATLNSKEGRWIMVTAIMASAMAFIDGTALNVVLPSLQNNLQATGADIFWILNAYLLMLASLILIGGALGDKLGRKRVFMWGIFLFIIGSGLCGLATSVFYLVVFRILQGVGGALMIPGSLALISSSIQQKERGKAIGTWSAVTTMVTLGGPVLGGALADAGLWRYIFFINVPIGVLNLVFLWKNVQETKKENERQRLDVAGAALLAAGLALLTFGFLRMPSAGWNSWQVYLSLAGGISLLIAFVFVEKKSSYPMMPLHLFNSRVFTGVNLLTFFLYAGLGALLFLGLNFVQVQGYSQLQSGLTFLPFTLLMITVSRYSGGLADKYGPKWFLIIGPLITAAGFLLLSFIQQTHGPADYWRTFFPGILLVGLGMSIAVAPLTASVMGAVSDQYSGTASGINNAVSRISNVFANAIFGALAVVFFTASMEKQLRNDSFNPREKQEIRLQVANLGNAKVPEGIAAEKKDLVSKQYHEGFIHAYAWVMRLSACCCITGALMAMVFFRNNPSGN